MRMGRWYAMVVFPSRGDPVRWAWVHVARRTSTGKLMHTPPWNTTGLFLPPMKGQPMQFNTILNQQQRSILRRQRERANLTQQDLGTRLGISFSQVSHLEVGSRNPTLPCLKAWCAWLSVDLTLPGIRLKARPIRGIKPKRLPGKTVRDKHTGRFSKAATEEGRDGDAPLLGVAVE